MTPTATEGAARPFRILSLDGGGIRGAFTAAFLSALERRVGHPLARFFDLIAGTSTGAIVAAGLAYHIPADEIERLYRERGPDIFRRRRPMADDSFFQPVVRWFLERFFLRKHGIDFDMLRQSRYDGAGLQQALYAVFGDARLEQARTRLLIPAIDLTRGQTVTFKTPHLPNMIRDRYYRIVDILLATTAAPTYFPHATIDEGGAFVDGGLWANNPSMVALVEAMRIRQHDPCFDLPHVHLLSVGTGSSKFYRTPPTRGGGIAWWGAGLLDIPFIAQAQGICFQAGFMLQDRFVRVDYDVPDESWTLDSVENLPQMLYLGRNQGEARFPALHERFFGTTAPPYQPLPDPSPPIHASAGRLSQ